MYSQASYCGARHERISETNTIGLISFIYVRQYKVLAPTIHTTLTDPTLNCYTYLQIPRTHILFSLQSSHIVTHETITAEASVRILTVDPAADTIRAVLQQEGETIWGCITALRPRSRAHNTTSNVPTPPEETSDSDSDKDDKT